MTTVLSTETKCSKPLGSYCRLHNPAPTNQVENLQEKIRRLLTPSKSSPPLTSFEVKDILNHEWEVDVMMKNLKMKVDPKTGKKTVSVFRAGVPEPPKERGVEKDYYIAADDCKPEGRQGRYDAVFASPTLTGVASWVRGVANVVPDCKVRELRVDPDKTYVYSVRAWEKASGPFGDLKTNMEEYWKTGITLTEWIGRFSKDETMKSVEWELLLNVNDLESIKPVAAKRVAGNAYRSNTEEGTLDSYLMRLLK